MYRGVLRPAPLRHGALSVLLVGAVVLATVTSPGIGPVPATATACPTGNVYLTASGNSANDLAIAALLEDGTGLCVTVGVEYRDLDGSVDLDPYDSVYLQANYNYGYDLPADGAAAILAHVAGGGGLVTAEWSLWQVGSSYPGWTDLEPILPVTYASWYSPKRVRFSRLDRAADPILDRGVSADFVFEPSDAAGTFSRLVLKDGATAFYVATGTTSSTDEPPAAAPLGTAGVTVGMAGWTVGENGGRVFSFATTNGAPEIADDLNVRRLILNALGWVGGVVVALEGDVEELPTPPEEESTEEVEESGEESTEEVEESGEEGPEQVVPSAPPTSTVPGPASNGVPAAPAPVPAGEGRWNPIRGDEGPLSATTSEPGILRLEGEGLSVTLRGAPRSGLGEGTVPRVDAIECEVCHALAAGGVIEVWMFSEPRLVAAHRVDDLPCQRFTIPLATPLDGDGPLAAGAHTLQLMLPTSSGMSTVAIGLTLSDPVPSAVPAGEGRGSGVGNVGVLARPLLAGALLLLLPVALRRSRRIPGRAA